MAAEFPAETNYLYATYHARAHRRARPSLAQEGPDARLGRLPDRLERRVRLVLRQRGAGGLRRSGYETIMLNYNPETVSTDYDICDRLVFDEISLETVLDLCEREQPDGVVVSMGGQIPNNLAMRLRQAGRADPRHQRREHRQGRGPRQIQRAPRRARHRSAALGARHRRRARPTRIVEQLGGFPVLVRPSYVLSGAAMAVAHEPNELRRILARASAVSPEHPVVISKFETHAREIEIDAVADRGELVLWAICEHIEDAGVHSGDATLVLPPQTLYIATIRRVQADRDDAGARAVDHRARSTCSFSPGTTR